MNVGRPPPELLDEAGNLCGFFEHWVRRAPERVALLEPRVSRAGDVVHDEVTFAALDRYASRIAHGLAARGVGRGDRVLLMVPMSSDLYATLLAVGKLGGCAVFVDPWASLDDMAHMARTSSPRVFVGVPKAHLLRAFSREFRRIPLKVSVGGPALLGARLEDLARGQPESFPSVRVSPDDGALLTFTTGSTGRPKGALRSHAFLNAQGDALARHLPREHGDVEMTSLPAFVLSNLSAGVPSVLPLVDLKRIDAVDPALIVAQLEACHVTTLGGSPPFVARVARYCTERGRTLERIRGVATGGAAVSSQLLEDLQRAFPCARGNIRVLYGSTEVEPISQVEADEVLATLDVHGGVLVGRPVPELSLRLVDPLQRELLDVAAGEPGEVVVAGSHVQGEYFQDAEATARTKIKEGDTLWHRTGDVARRDAEGRLWLLGRAHEIVYRADGALYPLVVENVAGAVPGVHRAALAERDGRALVALQLEASRAAADVVGDVERALAAAGLPVSDVIVLASLPVDPRHNAKIDQPRLKALLERAA